MSPLHLQPTFDAFEKLATEGNLVAVWAELSADFETPLSAYLKIREDGCGFLLESAEEKSHSGRYSFLGSAPRTWVVARGRQVTVTERGQKREIVVEGDALQELEKLMAQYQGVGQGPVPGFHGGAVGYLAYDMVRYFEPTLPEPPPDQLGLPDMVFMITDVVLVFDHRHRKFFVVANVHLDEHEGAEAAYEWGRQQIAAMMEKLAAGLNEKAPQSLPPVDNSVTLKADSNTTQAEYEAMVLRAQEYIGAGDIFQVVPSQRFEMPYSGTPTNLFRALRHVNPSPYMFCMELPDGFALVGASPEVHVKCVDGGIEIRPIAGTRPRGATEQEDMHNAIELLKDPKERAEHVMLVDLARNDVGRAAVYGTVHVDDLMVIERYSHVMHIVSNVSGRLRENCSAYDVMRATFPAGTVSGSPKVRAMEIISELEKSKRCAYAGALGYFGFDGNLDSCIALRTCVVKDGKAYVQAGAGVVEASVPFNEYQETVNKAQGMLRAVELASHLA
ncbi:MAG: anthranilate synthase component I [Verrucomicrobiales bacterium]|nr:anthranilate synthase component I [Verrucomicrobiales bacterium]